ncbi:MAG: GDSL-type esterase/lipase family protein [Candidatus Eisenbacteria bacterium]
MSSRRVGRAFALVCLYVLVILAGLELGTRLFRPQNVFSSTVNTWDERLGTRQVPGATGFVSCDEYDVEISINSRGLRDREFPYEKPEGVRRILSLGDSFACGYGVAVDRTYAKVLERELSRRQGVWEVLNAGVGSTGTAHQLAYFLDEGRKYEPDIVLVGVFVGNDLWDNVLSGLYSLEDGSLVRHPAPFTSARKIQRFTKWLPGYGALLSRSHFLTLLRLEIAQWHRRQLTDSAHAAEPEAAHDAPMELTRRLLTEFEKACDDRGATLVVMLVPVPERQARPADQREATLAAFLRDQGVPCLNLGPVFRAERGRRTLEFAHDCHWTEIGHRLAAIELMAFLDGRSLLSPVQGLSPPEPATGAARS